MALDDRSRNPRRTASSVSKLLDSALLERFTAGRDEAAFAELLRRHGPVVWNVCRRIVRHQEDAEDAFQATFLVLVQKARSIRKRDSLRSWLQGVARRIAMKVVRARYRRIQFLDRLFTSCEGEAFQADPDKELWSIVAAELELLPQQQRLVIQKCVVEGHSYREVASELNIPVSTVASHLRRGRQSLKARLAAHGLCVAGAAMVAKQLPAALCDVTVKNAGSLLMGNQGALPIRVVALMKGAIASMSTTAKALLVLVFACATSSSTWWLSAQPHASVPSSSSNAGAATESGLNYEYDIQAVPVMEPSPVLSISSNHGTSSASRDGASTFGSVGPIISLSFSE